VSAAPLRGRRVVITRARSQRSALADRLAGLGATVVELPVIEIEDPPDGGSALSAAADRLVAGSYRWVAFTSSNAVSRLLAALGNRVVPTGVSWAAVGTGTARTLTDGGFPPELVPEVSVSDALAEAFPESGRDDRQSRPGAAVGPDAVLFPRAEQVRGALAEGLRAKGWQVDEVVAYRTVAGRPDPDQMTAAGRADAIAFTSSSTVERAVDLLGPGGVPAVVVSIGPVTTGTAREAGLHVAAEASPHTIGGLVEAVVEALALDASTGGGSTDLP
jgi:uroporphyrinogen-III synthase